MKAEAVCAVEWCPALRRPGRVVCEFHAARPVLHGGEKHDDYIARIRREESSRKIRPPATEEPMPLITDDTAGEPDIALPKLR